MATAMQNEAKASNIRKPTTAEQSFEITARLNNKNEDGRLDVMAEICCKEAVARAEEAQPNEKCFSFAVTVAGEWAYWALSRVSPNLPKTRGRLARYIADGWLGTKNLEAEARFVRTLGNWPPEDEKVACNAIRLVVEQRYSELTDKEEMLRKLTLFFVSTGVPVEDSEMWRTVFKAIASTCATMEDLYIAGKLLHISRGRDRSLISDQLDVHFGP